jgi:hypothetical protein
VVGLPRYAEWTVCSAVNGTRCACALRIRCAYLECRSCGPGFGWSSGEAEPRAVIPGVGGSFPVAETLSTSAAAVLTLVVLSAPALPFRDGSKAHQGDGGGSGGSSVQT